MCWKVRRPIPEPSKGVISDHYKREGTAATLLGAAIGGAVAGPLGALACAAGGAGLHRTFLENDRTQHKGKIDQIVAESTQEASVAQARRDNTITASLAAGLFVGIKKICWG